MGQILLYGFEELNDILAVKAAAERFDAEVRPVWREDYRTPVGALAGRVTRAGRPGAFEGRLRAKMLVFCDLGPQLDGLLAALRAEGVGPECYKAVLTAYNQDWDALSLLAALQRERRELEKQRKGRETP